MREILFRGKCKDNGEWVEGFIHCVTDNYTPKNCWDITTFKKLDNEEIVLTGQYEVIPETVGQYTGLTDKNGTKIFEGDIIRDTTDNELLVVEGTTAFGFYFKYVTEPDDYVTVFDLGISDDDTYLTSCIIVGNIHSNPELLEVE